MKTCCVPGCSSNSSNLKSEKVVFYNFPNQYVNGAVDPVQNPRRLEWLKVVQPSEPTERILICSRHFVTGQPAKRERLYETDWIPSVNLPENVYDENIDDIIRNLPEVVVQFDVPEYIFLDRVKFNEKKIEMDLIHKYLSTSVVCDVKGCYINDHDYLGLQVLPTVTEAEEAFSEEHSYSIGAQPACCYLDSRHFCNICRHNFENLFGFNKHMVDHTTANDVVCPICLQRFLTSTCLNNHLGTHTSLCEKCGNYVPTVQMGDHQDANYKQKYQNYDILRYKIPKKAKVHFCVLCMRKFGNDTKYRDHLYLHKKTKLRLKTS